jgi:thymidylate kinase
MEIMYSIISRIRHAIAHCRGTVYCERSVLSTIVFFAVSPHICSEERQVVRDFASMLHGGLGVPVLSVYLSCDPAVALDRIRQRDRDGEEGIDFDYLLALDGSHRRHLRRVVTASSHGQRSFAAA